MVRGAKSLPTEGREEVRAAGAKRGEEARRAVERASARAASRCVRRTQASEQAKRRISWGPSMVPAARLTFVDSISEALSLQFAARKVSRPKGGRRFAPRERSAARRPGARSSAHPREPRADASAGRRRPSKRSDGRPSPRRRSGRGSRSHFRGGLPVVRGAKSLPTEGREEVRAAGAKRGEEARRAVERASARAASRCVRRTQASEQAKRRSYPLQETWGVAPILVAEGSDTLASVSSEAP